MIRTCKKTSGVSLVELLIVFFVFSIIIVMVADMSRLAIRSQVKTTDTVEARRKALTVLTKMRFEFSTCRSLESPDPNVGTYGWWTPHLTEPLALHINRQGGTKLITYWFNSSTGVLWRKTPTEEKPVLQDVVGFEFQQTPGPKAHVMQARLRMKGAVQPVTVWGRAIRV